MADRSARKSSARAVVARPVREASSRKTSTREIDTATHAPWVQQDLLAAPPPRDGMRQHWVSTEILGETIPHHVAKRRNEGWIPRPVDTVPESFFASIVETGRFKGCIGTESMILCEMPEERVAARDAFMKARRENQNQFVDAQLDETEREAGRSAPRLHRESETQTHNAGTRRPSVLNE